MYNVQNWYWIVGGDESQVYSSAASAYVPITDASYEAWILKGEVPTRISANDMLLMRIGFLEIKQTQRRIRESSTDDAGGSIQGRAWMANLEAQIEALRTQLVG